MVTSYYIMKMTRNRELLTSHEHFSNILNEPKSKVYYFSRDLLCRVCLKTAAVCIHDKENAKEIKEALQIFGNIVINEEDASSGYLCNICYKFVHSAILFRKVAKRTNEVINERIEASIRIGHDCDNLKNSDIENNHDVKLENLHLKTENIVHNRKSNKLVSCEVCKKLIQKSYYKTHITIHESTPPKYVCDICGKTFRLRPGYYNHRLRHRTDYPYKCKLCPFKAKYVDSLKSHMHTHSGQYRFMCTECPERFVFKGNFNRHVLLKHSEPQYKCTGCDKSFHTKILLQRHNNVEHLGLREHVCNICGKAFGYKSAMNKHERTVHKRETLKFYSKPFSKVNNIVTV